MGKIVWTEAARRSLKEIWQFYEEKDSGAADRIIDENISTAEKIRFDEQYQVVEILGQGFRRVVVRYFKVIYRVQKDQLRILEIFDARQNPGKLKL